MISPFQPCSQPSVSPRRLDSFIENEKPLSSQDHLYVYFDDHLAWETRIGETEYEGKKQEASE